MKKAKEIHKARLNAITINIVNELGKVGVFRYNKLTYLFEYLFIKNYGERYTHQMFPKLPHGPVIGNYKKVILNQCEDGFIDADVKVLKLTRKLSDDRPEKKETIWLKKTSLSKDILIPEKTVYNFLLRVLDKYGSLSDDEIEELVYKTSAVINYEKQYEAGFKSKTGGFVLESDCIKINSSDSIDFKARQFAIKHELKHPDVNTEQQSLLYYDLAYLEQLRPIL